MRKRGLPCPIQTDCLKERLKYMCREGASESSFHYNITLLNEISIMDSVRTEILENHPISLNTIVNRIYSKLILKIGIRLLLEIAHQSESIQIENGELREVLVLLS